MGSLQVFKNYKWPSTPGDYYRLLILTGEKKGYSYILGHGRLIIGRGTKAQVIIDDNKMSREHAEIVFINGYYVITDLGSQNGIIVNNKKLKQTEISHEDKIIIGQTVFRFDHQYIAPKIESNEIESEDEDEEVEVEIIAEAKSDKKNTKIKGAKKDNKKIIIYGIAIIAVGFLLFSEDPKNEASKENKVENTNVTKEEVQDFVQEYKNSIANSIKGKDEQTQRIITVINEGLREAREHNYFRAINQFNLALIMDPSNSRASRYLDQVKNELEATVKKIMLKAKWEFESLNYQAALVEYCSVIRLFQNQSENEYYINSLDEIKNILELIGKDYSENYCL